MAYSDFTLSKLQRKFGIEYHRDNLFLFPLKKTEPSERLKMDIDEGLLMPVFSEKAKSELIITPIFREIRRTNHNKFRNYVLINANPFYPKPFPLEGKGLYTLVRKVLPLKGKDLGWGIMTCINKYILPINLPSSQVFHLM